MKLEFQNVNKDYHLQRALNQASFSVESRDVVGIVGPNGAGKTTLIKLAALLAKPSAGKIFIDGLPIHKIDRSKLGLISPNTYLYSDLTVAENLELYSKLYKTDSGYWLECAEYFNLTDMLRKPVRELSHGQKQRAALARVMLGNPEILLLDEPFLGLDTQATEELINLILKLQTEGGLIMMATHHFEIATNIINRVMVLDRGRLVHFDAFDKTGTSLSDLYSRLLERTN